MSVKAGPPATAEAGLRLLSAGAKIDNERAPETSALLTTVTGKAPAVVRRDAGTAAVSWVRLTKVVGRLVLPKTAREGVQFVPLQSAGPTKPAPVSVSVNPAPFSIEDAGDSEVNVG